MDKQNVILKTHELEVIGQGGMINGPCQIGEWWVMPAEMYTGTIPPEIQAKWENFKALNIPVVGYLIADDMRDVLLKREKKAEEQREKEAEHTRQLAVLEAKRQEELQIIERQRRKEATDKAIGEAVQVGTAIVSGVGAVVGAVVVGTAMVAAGIVLAILRFDPILIAVMPDGRWICLGAWWE